MFGSVVVLELAAFVGPSGLHLLLLCFKSFPQDPSSMVEKRAFEVDGVEYACLSYSGCITSCLLMKRRVYFCAREKISYLGKFIFVKR